MKSFVIFTVIILSSLLIEAQSGEAKISSVQYIPSYNKANLIDSVKVIFSTDSTVHNADIIEIDFGIGELRDDSLIRKDFDFGLVYSQLKLRISYPRYLKKK